MGSKHQTDIHLCKDGSHTVYSQKFHQHYHSPAGAIAESRHVFFDTPGLISHIREHDPFYIFEMGFGTGLNLLLLLDELSKLDGVPNVVYHAVEAYPLQLEQVMKLNYPEKLKLTNAPEITACVFRNLEPGLNEINVSKNVSLQLYIGLFEQMPDPGVKFHSMLFDPFSPESDPVLWRDEVFKNLAGWSDPGVLLATYCASSAARAAMAVAGWSVARAPGAPGKREMTLAALDPERLAGWKRVNEQRLAERYLKGEFA